MCEVWHILVGIWHSLTLQKSEPIHLHPFMGACVFVRVIHATFTLCLSHVIRGGVTQQLVVEEIVEVRLTPGVSPNAAAFVTCVK